MAEGALGAMPQIWLGEEGRRPLVPPTTSLLPLLRPSGRREACPHPLGPHAGVQEAGRGLGSSLHPGPALSIFCPPPVNRSQFSSVAQSCPILCHPMDCSIPGLPVQTKSQNLVKLMSVNLVMPSNHFILCHPLLIPPSIFPSIRVFSNESALHNCQSIGISASTSGLPMNIQD